MRKELLCILVFLIGLTTSCTKKNEVADIIYYNATIYTVDSDQPYADAIAIKENQIIGVGKEAEVMKFKGKRTKMKNLLGKFMMPGFIESHIHPGVTALIGTGVNLIGTKSFIDIQNRLLKYIEKNTEKNTILGYGWPLSAFNNDGPNKYMLDSIVKDKRVMLIDGDAHTAWMNSAALEALGITKNTPDPQPNVHYYKRDKEGNPTGWCIEGESFWPYLKKLGLGTTADFEKEYTHLLPVFSKMGITSLMDAGIPNVEENAFQALIELDGEGLLPLRYMGTHYVTSGKSASTAVEDYLNLSKEYKSDKFGMLAIKIPNDGTIEAKTAALKFPYYNAPNIRGEVLFNQDYLTELFSKARSKGVDIHMHAIGDRTIHEGLNAVEQAKKNYPNADNRVTLCHLQLIDGVDLPRFNELGAIAQVSPNWVFDAKGNYIDFLTEALGEKRAKRQFQNHSLFKSGAVVSLGSDFPASGSGLEASSPIYTLEIGQTRQEPGEPLARVFPSEDECLSVEEIIKGYTINAAYQLRLEDKVGSLEKGKLADLIVLSANPFEVDVHQVHHIQVMMTMVDGEVVYETYQ